MGTITQLNAQKPKIISIHLFIDGERNLAMEYTSDDPNTKGYDDIMAGKDLSLVETVSMVIGNEPDNPLPKDGLFSLYYRPLVVAEHMDAEGLLLTLVVEGVLVAVDVNGVSSVLPLNWRVAPAPMGGMYLVPADVVRQYKETAKAAAQALTNMHDSAIAREVVEEAEYEEDDLDDTDVEPEKPKMLSFAPRPIGKNSGEPN